MDTAEILIRIATSVDLAELARLNAAFNGNYETPEDLAQRIAAPHCVETPIVALLGEQAVGFAAVRVVPRVFYAAPYGELTELYVEPDFRGLGVARQLVAYAERLAKDMGVEELFVLTGPDNEAALALYHCMGYMDNDLALSKSLS